MLPEIVAVFQGSSLTGLLGLAAAAALMKFQLDQLFCFRAACRREGKEFVHKASRELFQL